MPGSPWPIFFWLKEIKELIVRRLRLAVGPIYAAAVMIVVAAVLLFTIVGGLKHTAREAPSAKIPPHDAGSPVQVVREIADTAGGVEVKSNPDALSDTNAAAKPTRQVITGEEVPYRPVRGKVRQDFGWQQHPVYNDWRYHTGIDIETSEGAAVRALYDGEITTIYDDKNYGPTVVISSGPYMVYYGSLAVVTVAKGQYITAGAKIGTVGLCGAEPYFHLHLAINTCGKYANPQEILSKAQ